jgi:hypothetical protein
MYNIGYPQMARMPAICKRQDEGYRKRDAAEDALKQDWGSLLAMLTLTVAGCRRG